MKKSILLIFILVIFQNTMVLAYCHADFTFEATAQPGEISFLNYSESGGEIIQYYWDFGDGDISTQMNPVHQFLHPGRFLVFLTIVTPSSCIDVQTKEIVIGIQDNLSQCEINLLVESNNATQPHYNNGWIVVAPENQSEIFSIQWSNGCTQPLNANLAPGFYCVTVTDLDNCYATECFEIGFNNNCLSSFYIDSLTYHHIPGCYRFVNNSHGEASNVWWEFGDGTTSNQHSPVHLYPEPGQYEVCLHFESYYGCDDVFCQTISIQEVIPLINLNGKVYAGNSLLPEGMAVLYHVNGSSYDALQTCEVSNGGFGFNNLDTRSKFIVQVIPSFDINTTYFPKYLSSYFSDSTFWQNSRLINFPNDTLITISLKANHHVYYGEGSIKGTVYFNESSSYEENIFHVPWFNSIGNPVETRASNIVVFLSDNNRKPIDFCLSENSGAYKFENLENGLYYLRAEKAGLISQEIPVVINDVIELVEAPDLIILSSTIQTDIDDSYNFTNQSISPNPCETNLNFLNLENYKIGIYTITGEKKIEFYSYQKNFTYDISDLKSGNYIIVADNGTVKYVKKILKL